MKDEIKEILQDVIDDIYQCGEYIGQAKKLEKVLDYITNLEQENERLKEQNNDLRKIYKNTYNRLFEKGNDELARYFQAQIDDCPTFYVEPIIDYAKEWLDYKSRIDKAIEYIKECQLGVDGMDRPYMLLDQEEGKDLLNILGGDEE